VKWALPFTPVNFTGQARFTVNGLAIVYQAPFDRCDREQDYEIVWAEFGKTFWDHEAHESEKR